MRGLGALAVALALLTAAGRAAAEEPSSGADDAPPVRYPPSSIRAPLIGGGLALTGGAYGLSVLCATQWPEVPGSDALKVPVVGPWIALGQSGCAGDDPNCGFTKYFRAVLTVIDGLVQAGGLGLVGEGLFMKTEAAPAKAAERDEPPAVVSRRNARIELTPVPVVTPSTTGLGVVGTF